MLIKRASVVTRAGDVVIPTGLPDTGTQGMSIVAIGFTLLAGDKVPVSDPVTGGLLSASYAAGLSTRAGAGSSTVDPDTVAYVQFVNGNPTLQKEVALLVPRLTVQPNLYLSGYNEGFTDDITVEVVIYYETVQLKEIEFLRLQAGGA